MHSEHHATPCHRLPKYQRSNACAYNNEESKKQKREELSPKDQQVFDQFATLSATVPLAVGLKGPGFRDRLRQQICHGQGDDDRAAQKEHRDHDSTQFAVPPCRGRHRPHALPDHEVRRDRTRLAGRRAKS